MKQIEFQFAMDGAATKTIEDAIQMIGDIAEYLDIVEVGTSFVLRYGMEAVRQIKEAFPEKKVLADMKIMDGGYHHTAMGCQFGGDIITVMGAADPQTIQNAVQAAHDNGKAVMVDLLRVEHTAKVIALCEKIGTDYICVHCGVDMQAQGKNPYLALREAISLTQACKVAVAGGINGDTVQDICRLGPDVVIVGSAIHARKNFMEVAAQIRSRIDLISKEL